MYCIPQDEALGDILVHKKTIYQATKPHSR